MSLISKAESPRPRFVPPAADSCRACGKGGLSEVLDLGPMPLAGDFRPAGAKNLLYPLAIDVCSLCGLLQVRQEVSHEIIFSPSYSYSSSTIPALVRHFESYASEVTMPAGGVAKRLLEIGCNDGVFLTPLRKAGYDVIGVDACENVVAMAQAKGLRVSQRTFGKAAARALHAEHGTFDVITCSNVFAHNPDLGGFLEGVDLLLDRRGGEFWVEVHSAKALYEGLQWDCFYHEHCFYWSIHSLKRCLERYGLFLRRYKTTPMHGGALRAVFGRGRESEAVQEQEILPDDWASFGVRSTRSKEVLRSAVRALGIRYAYGAAGRAVTLINWSGIAPNLEFVVDGSPLRYGRVIPNSQVPIISEDEFARRGDPGEWCFVTAHNYLSDIRRKVSAFFPGKSPTFATPLPYVALQ